MDCATLRTFQLAPPSVVSSSVDLSPTAYACVALTARTGDTLIEMFGLCDVREGSNPPPGAAYRARAHRDNSIAWRLAPGQVALPAPYAESLRSQVVVITPGRLTFRVVGNAVDPTAVAFMRSAQRWWKHMEVRWRSEGGRPPNQPQTRYELVLDAIRDLRESDEDYPGAAAPKIDQESVGQWMLPPISNRTVRRTVKEAKKSWAEALTDASVKFTGYR